MISIKHISIIGIFGLSVFYCNPKTMLTGVTHTSDVDSVLFYQQNPVADPFLDALQSNPGNSARLTTMILPPPPPPPPDFREIEGFRVQLFAGTDSTGAVIMQQKAESEIDTSVYLFKEAGLFKIQVGDYPYRMDADNMKLKLNDLGFTGAWVVKRLVHVPGNTINADSTVQPMASPSTRQAGQMTTGQLNTESTSAISDARFKIQVLATSDEMKARQLELDLESQFSEDAYYELSGNNYKVYIGKFQTRPEAEKLLKRVRENGYPDAWLVY